MERFGREPENEEIAFELGIPVNKGALPKTVTVRPASLDAPLSELADTWMFGDLIFRDFVAQQSDRRDRA